MTGAFRGEVDLGTGPITDAGDSISLLLAKFDEFGNALWGRSFGGGIYQGGNHLTTTASNDIVLTGSSNGAVDLGTGPLSARWPRPGAPPMCAHDRRDRGVSGKNSSCLGW
jgi:hypothetical protein